MKTKLNAWLSPYSDLTPEQIVKGGEKAVSSLFYTDNEQIGDGYTKVGTADVDVTLFDMATLIDSKRQALEAELAQEIADSHVRQEKLKEKIQNLLALPNMAEVAE